MICFEVVCHFHFNKMKSEFSIFFPEKNFSLSEQVEFVFPHIFSY